MTTSPRSTPRARRAPETPALIAISSPKCQTRRSPFASIASSAGRDDGELLEDVGDEVHVYILARHELGTVRLTRLTRSVLACAACESALPASGFFPS